MSPALLSGNLGLMTSATQAPTARKAVPEEARTLAEVLATAFVDDPVVGWMFPDAVRRRELLTNCFEVEITAGIAHEAAYAIGTVEGGAVWVPPEALEKPEEEVAAFVSHYLRAAGEFSDRVLQLLEFLDERGPSEPHYSLELIGTRPEDQGRGLGSALLGPVLTSCDRDRIPAYLWSSNPRNLPFYERHGFKVTEGAVLPGGPPAWQMRREPRPGRRLAASDDTTSPTPVAGFRVAPIGGADAD
jgi:GNAT superfamily N-acetyltransferase